MNRMFETCIKESKVRPDFSGTDAYQVNLTLPGEIQAPQFLKFLDKIDRNTLQAFTTQDLLVLDLIHREQKIPEDLKPYLPQLIRQGLIESQGRGRGTHYFLSRNLYTFIGEKGAYTRQRGLDRETNKALLLKHIEDNRKTGSPIRELMQVLPALSRDQIRNLLQDLKKEDKIYNKGQTWDSRWYPGN